jgi:hypothetical protein
MGVLVILSLVYKRHREKLKRPWRIWYVEYHDLVLRMGFSRGHSPLSLIQVVRRIQTSRWADVRAWC